VFYVLNVACVRSPVFILTALAVGLGGGAFPALAQTISGVSVSPPGTAASRLPSNGTNYTITFTVTDTSNAIGPVIYDLLTSQRPGGASALTTVSITGTGVIQGANPDSAQVTLLPGGAVVATVTYAVGNVTAGSIDTLVFLARALGSLASDTGKLVVTVIRPSVTVVKSVNPIGTPPPGTDLTYTLTLTNAGTEHAVSVVHVDSVPAQIGFKVASVSTTLPGGVTATVAYSNNSGTTWTYVPVSAGCGAPAGYDYCVRDIRISLGTALSNVGPNNIVQVVFVAKVK